MQQVLIISLIMYYLFPRRCPVCRTEIQGWTTKKLAQLTLDEQRRKKEISLDKQENASLNEQRQTEKVSLDKTRQQDEISMDEQKQLEEVSFDEYRLKKVASLDEQRQQDQVFRITHNDVAGLTSNNISCELYPVGDSKHFLHCLRCLNEVKAELSCLEIIFILVSNLSMVCCRKRVLIKNSNAEDILLALNNIEHIVRYSLQKVQNAHLKMSSLGLVDRAMLYHCFFKIRSTLRQLEVFSTDAFPHHEEDIHKQLFVIIKIVCEIEHILHPKDKKYTTKVCDNSD